MQKLLPFVSLLIFLLSCNKEKDLVPKTPVDLTDSIEGSKFEVTMSKSLSAIKPDETYHLLGYGYDVTSAFADANSAREAIIDINIYKNKYPSYLLPNLGVIAGPRTYIAENAEEYSKSLTNQISSIQGGRLFRSAVTSFFPDSNSLSAKYMYGSFSYLIQQKHYKSLALKIFYSLV